MTGNKNYVPGGSYHGMSLFPRSRNYSWGNRMRAFETDVFATVFAGKDASRGLGKSSVKPEDAVAEWEDLGPEEKQVLDDWYG